MAYPRNDDGTINVHLTEDQVELTKVALQWCRAEMLERCKKCGVDTRSLCEVLCEDHALPVAKIDLTILELNEAGT